MPDKRALNSFVFPVTDAILGNAFGNHVPANMRRYIYKIKTVNQFNGANRLEFGYEDDADPAVQHILDYIDHALIHDMWNDPDEITEHSLPIYILPAGSQPWGRASAAGDIDVYILYEDAP